MKYRPGVFLLTIFISFFLTSPAFAADNVSGVLQFHAGDTATATDVNTVHNGLRTAIDTATDFGSILSVVTVTGTAGIASSAQADCTAGTFATGGGCAISTATDIPNIPKLDEPVVLGGSPTGWNCACQAVSGQTCTSKATVICAQ